MIDLLDDTLSNLLTQKVPIDTTQYDINFEMPNKDWESKLQKPVTINLHLYDIRENHELRSNDRFLSRNGATGKETREPVRIDMSYMITVWTKTKDDVKGEHRILGNILQTLLRYPILPTEVVPVEFQSRLKDMTNQPLPLRAWVTQPERAPNAWEFWTAVEGQLKAGLSYMVTVPVQPFTPIEVPLVTQTQLKVTSKEILE